MSLRKQWKSQAYTRKVLSTGHLLEVAAGVILTALFVFAAVRTLQVELQQRPSKWKGQHPTSVPLQYDSPTAYQHVQPGQPFVVRGSRYGFRKGSNWRPLRLEISQLVGSGPAFDLYLQCQNKIMARSQDDVLSYYEIAGIHGKPHRPWNKIQHSDGIEAGYAPHGSILFPVWHRPYVAMYEQLLSECAVSLADEYPLRLRYLYHNVALNLRLPYWDWASDSSLPDIVNYPTWMTRTPKGIEEIPNPLFRYVFHPIPGSASSPDEAFEIGKFTDLPSTVRAIDDGGVIQIEKANALLQREGNFMQLTHKLLTRLNGSFAHFADRTVAEVSEAETTISIENIHNHVHELIAGHMSSQYAAFDPLFWLHHVNIDRIFAFWQAMYPNGTESYVVPEVNYNGTRSTAPGTIEDLDSPLMPFAFDDTGVMHTARTVQHTHLLGYSYAELQHLHLTPTDLAMTTYQTVQQLYGNESLWTGR